MKKIRALAIIAAAMTWNPLASAGEAEQDLARQLTNPVAALISVPLQLNYNSDIGPADDGRQWVLNIQPVIPFSLSEDWNLISRTILPIVDQQDVFPGAGGQTGLGDTVQSLFFSPAAPTAGGWIWGAGPVLLLPTGTDDLLTTDKWGIGPTAVALRQLGPWTSGLLGNHIWSVAGDSDRRDISTTFLQPFLSFTTPTAWTYTLQSESTYDWEGSEWQVPIRGVVTKVTRIGNQLVSLGGGVNYWLESSENGPEGWGLRFTLTLLFPR
ncbi:MAG TPA: transporter [Thioalkalivibrio sp.]|nr:transporter [Thioalkalivibrio sp.]